MKKFKLILIIGVCFLLSACLNVDDFSDEYIYTTIYPIEYATDIIYGDNSKVASIYPDGSNYKDFKLTEKLLNNYSKSNKFIYNGLSSEGLIARDLLNKNNNIEIVDAMKGMSYTKGIEELWLDPSNFLMVCRNIKSTLIDYEDSVTVKSNIEKNYQKLKENISIIDVDIYNLSKNGSYKTLLVTTNTFNYLTKYGINVVSIDPSNESLDKALSEARKLISSNDVRYIYAIKGEELSESVNTFINDNKLTKIEIDSFTTITQEERLNGSTYVSLMNNIIDEFKKELFK